MRVVCAQCGKKLKAPESLIGQEARCPHCKTKFVVKKPTDISDDVELAPLDEEEERERERKRREIDQEFESEGTYGLAPNDDQG